MLEILIGIISGIVSGMGMGGGTILILILTLFFGIEQHKAQAINFIFFIPTSFAAIWMNYRQKNINIKLGITVGTFGIIGSVVGAKISNAIDNNILKRFFGVFLGIIAIHEIYNIIKSNKSKKSNI